MAQLIVRNLDESVKTALRLRAKRHGHSMEEEARNILSAAAMESDEPSEGLGTRIANRFRGIGFDLKIEELRGTPVKPIIFK